MRHNKKINIEDLNHFSIDDLRKMVVKLAAKRYNYDYLLINFLDQHGGEQTLYEDTLEDLKLLISKQYNGKTVQHQRVKMLQACVKRINDFKVEAKSKKAETDLLMFLLEWEFCHDATVFGAKFSGFDFKIATLLRTAIKLISTKLHPDYFIDYQDRINQMLDQLHQSSDRIPTVKSLPTAI